MNKNKRFTVKKKDLKYAKILENGKDLTGYFFVAQAEFICDKMNELSEENEQLKKENQAIQSKVFKLLDWLEKEKEVNRNEIKEW